MYGAPQAVATATIAASGTTSTAIDTAHYTHLAIQFPAAMTGTTMTIQGKSAQDGTWATLEDDAGNAYSITVTAGVLAALDAAFCYAAPRFLRFVSGSSEAAERTLTIHMKANA